VTSYSLYRFSGIVRTRNPPIERIAHGHPSKIDTVDIGPFLCRGKTSPSNGSIAEWHMTEEGRHRGECSSSSEGEAFVPTAIKMGGTVVVTYWIARLWAGWYRSIYQS
jgi:hypothetical protein